MVKSHFRQCHSEFTTDFFRKITVTVNFVIELLLSLSGEIATKNLIKIACLDFYFRGKLSTEILVVKFQVKYGKIKWKILVIKL